jgi:hypothetical protein
LFDLNTKGLIDMLDIPVLIYVFLIVGAALIAGYSLGYKDGHSEGYVRGRAIARAIRESEASK